MGFHSIKLLTSLRFRQFFRDFLFSHACAGKSRSIFSLDLTAVPDLHRTIVFASFETFWGMVVYKLIYIGVVNSPSCTLDDQCRQIT